MNTTWQCYREKVEGVGGFIFHYILLNIALCVCAYVPKKTSLPYFPHCPGNDFSCPQPMLSCSSTPRKQALLLCSMDGLYRYMRLDVSDVAAGCVPCLPLCMTSQQQPDVLRDADVTFSFHGLQLHKALSDSDAAPVEEKRTGRCGSGKGSKWWEMIGGTNLIKHLVTKPLFFFFL